MAYHMRISLIAVVAAMLVMPAMADEADDAYREKMRELNESARERQDDDAARVRELLRENAELRRQVEQLRAELAELREQLPDKPMADGQAQVELVEPESTFTSRAESIKEKNARTGTYSGREMREMLERAAEIDEAIAAHDCTPEVRAALYEGRPTSGATKEQLETIGTLFLYGEVDDWKQYDFAALDYSYAGGWRYDVVIDGQGVVRRVASGA